MHPVFMQLTAATQTNWQEHLPVPESASISGTGAWRRVWDCFRRIEGSLAEWARSPRVFVAILLAGEPPLCVHGAWAQHLPGLGGSSLEGLLERQKKGHKVAYPAGELLHEAILIWPLRRLRLLPERLCLEAALRFRRLERCGPALDGLSPC
jgi:hypothetical protein